MPHGHAAGPARRRRPRIRLLAAPTVLLVVLGLSAAALAARDDHVSAIGREGREPLSAGTVDPAPSGAEAAETGATVTAAPGGTALAGSVATAEPSTTGATSGAPKDPGAAESTATTAFLTGVAVGGTASPATSAPPAAPAPPAPPGTPAPSAAAAPAATSTVAERHDFGTSVAGRPLTAWRRAGSDRPTRRELVVGVIHGEEPGGRVITDLLLTLPLPTDLELWVVPTLNPDGEAVGQRGNANGVDLNRNFPTGWLAPGSDPYTSGGYHSGSGPASEPEVQAAMALIRSLRPRRTVWYHQPWEVVICEVAHAGRACTDYAARVGLEATSTPRPGSAIGWQQAEDLGAALVVELADGPPPVTVVERHVAAVLAG